jgi:two-component system cell cycle sensor histidine kinase/response regulator CckA
VTARQEAHDALRRSEQRYRQIVETANEGIVTLDACGYVEYANERMAQMLGYPVDEMLARHIEEFVHPSQHAYLRQRREQRRLGRREQYELRLLPRDGSELWTHVSASPIRGENEEHLGALGMFTDITERRRAEAGLRHIASRARCLLWHAEIEDDGGQKLRWRLQLFDEDAAQRFLPIEPAPGQSYADAWYLSRVEGDRQQSDSYGDREVRAGRSYTQQFRCRRSDGAVRWLAEDVQIEVVSPNRWRAVGVCTDITELKELEEQLLQSQKMEAIGRLAGGVAHDFNNMLAVITGYCELLLLAAPAKDSRQLGLQEIRKAADRAAGLTQQLLAFGRKQMVSLQVLDLNDTVLTTARMLRRLIGEDIDLISHLAPDLGRVEADPSQIVQVIVNLALNARDAMPAGGRLTIQTQNVEPGADLAPRHPDLRQGGYVALSVSDTGTGIDETVLGHIFEPFFTTKELGKGTGLGLATVYGIVKQSGGHIEVFSQPGQGTTFRICLPRVEPEAPTPPKRRVDAGLNGTETILLVEDDEMVRSLTSELLQMRGYTVLPAREGEEALSICRDYEGPIHLLLTDVVMPGANGRELSEQVSYLRPETKAMFMSGYTEDAIVRHGVLISEMPFLRKPFTPQLLAEKIREVLRDGA